VRVSSAATTRHQTSPILCASEPSTSPADRTRRRVALRERLAAVGLVAVGAALRLWDLPNVPGGLLYDEGYNYYDVLGVLGGARPVFFTGNYGREPLFIYLQAIAVSVWGSNAFSLRIVAAAFGVLAIPATFAVVQRLVNGPAALLAACWMATAPWALISSRIGLRAIATPALAAVMIYLFAAAAEEPRPRRGYGLAAAAGVAAAAPLATYIAARVLPIVPLAIYGLDALTCPRRRRTHPRRLVLAGLVGGVLLSPLIVYFALHPAAFFVRIHAVSAIQGESVESGRPDLVLRGLATSCLAFFTRGDWNWVHNLPFRPALDPPGALLLASGFVSAVSAARRSTGSRWLLGWFVVGLLPNALAVAGEADYLRLMPMMPAAAGLLGQGAYAWGKLLRVKGTAAALAAAATGLVVAAPGVYAFVFGWVQTPERFYSFAQDRTLVIRAALAEAASGRRAYGTGLDQFDMLGRMLLGPFETRRASLFDSDRALVAPPAGTPASYAISVAHPLPPILRRLLPAEGTPVAWDPSGAVAVVLYRVPERAAPRLDRPLAGDVEGIAELQGYTLPREARPGDTTAVVVAFETRRADPRDLVWRAHLLLDPSTGRWVGEDFRGFPAGAWRPGETVYLAFQLRVPGDVGSGAHPVELASGIPITSSSVPSGSRGEMCPRHPVTCAPLRCASAMGCC
jgi:4-amino-4-deoxy-L-arabinose transferase-like glycosyltransferase